MSRVLVIDDSPMLLELTVRALTAAGYQASGAQDLASLDQKLSEGPFALILMDVNMPEMFGDDVVEYLRGAKKVTAKLVLYSDISEAELAGKTKASGADACCTNAARRVVNTSGRRCSLAELRAQASSNARALSSSQ